MVEGMQYGLVTSSIWKMICSMDLSHRQYRGECAVQDYQNCSSGSCLVIFIWEKLYFTDNLAMTQISSYCG